MVYDNIDHKPSSTTAKEFFSMSKSLAQSDAAIRNQQCRQRRKERGGKEYKQYLLKDAERKRANYKRQEDLPEEERQKMVFKICCYDCSFMVKIVATLKCGLTNIFHTRLSSSTIHYQRAKAVEQKAKEICFQFTLPRKFWSN